MKQYNYIGLKVGLGLLYRTHRFNIALPVLYKFVKKANLEAITFYQQFRVMQMCLRSIMTDSLIPLETNLAI